MCKNIISPMTVIAKCLSLLTAFLSSLFQPPLLFLSPPSPTERKTAETACHPGYPVWSPEQLNNIVLKLSLLLSVSLNFLASCPPTQPLWPVSGLSRGVCLPQAQAANLHITELVLEELKLLCWTVTIACLESSKCHRAGASVVWHCWLMR